MMEGTAKIISARMEEYLKSEIDANMLKSDLEKLFMEVSIIAVTGHEKGEFPHEISDGLHRLKSIIEVLDVRPNS